MKNSFKLGFLALAITVSFAACKGSGLGSGSDTTDTSKKVVVDTTKKVVIDSTKKVVVDTLKKDTTKK